MRFRIFQRKVFGLKNYKIKLIHFTQKTRNFIQVYWRKLQKLKTCKEKSIYWRVKMLRLQTNAQKLKYCMKI